MNFKLGWNRRSFLAAVGAVSSSLIAPAKLSAAGSFGRKPKPAMPAIDGSAIIPITTGLGSTGDVYAELGVTPLVNINGTVTVIGGSVMKPEVMELIQRGNEHLVLIDELEIAAGKFIAKLCKSPAGYTGLVTGGAAAAMVVQNCCYEFGLGALAVALRSSYAYPYVFATCLTSGQRSE